MAVAEDTPNPDEPVLGTIGGYEIVERIGQGGMGTIYRARQPGLEREVAVKLIPEGKLAGRQDVERFRIEAAAAAELDHPNILPIYEVGDEDGQHFYSMPLVGGGSLAARVKEFARNPRAVAGLVRKISKAVHHAHQRGILHRDIKPANILLTRDSEPLVSDFGLAKRLGGRDAVLTQTGQMLGSPAYIAPEIASGKGAASVGSEVYSLGVVLFQLLAGEVPFGGTTQMEVLRHVVDREPPRPTSVAGGEVPRDLETICLKCLEKEPGRRYETAAALAEDLGHWLDGLPIEARPAGRAERMWKWAKRRPAAAGLICVSLLGAAALLLVLAESARRVGAERDVAITQRRAAQQGAYVSDMAAAYGALERGNLASARALVEQAGVVEGAESTRDFAWRLAWWLCQGEERRGWKAHESEVCSLLFAPEGGQLVTGSRGSGIKFWDYADAALLRSYPEELGYGIAYPIRRESYIAAGGLKNYEERVRGVPTRGVGFPISLAFLPGGRYLVAGGGSIYARVIDLEKDLPYSWYNMASADLEMVAGTNGLLAAGFDIDRKAERPVVFFDANKPTEHKPVRELGFVGSVVAASPDGAMIAAGNVAGSVRLWLKSNRFARPKEKELHRPIDELVVSLGGKAVAMAVGGQPEVRLWLQDSGQVALLAEHKAAVRSLAFSPDGLYLASGSNDQTVWIWLAGSGKAVRAFRGHSAPVTSIVWQPDGESLVSGSSDGEVKVWDFERGASMKRGESWHSKFKEIAISKGGSLLAGISAEGLISIAKIDGSERRDLPLGQPVEEERAGALSFYDRGRGLAVLFPGKASGRFGKVGAHIDFFDTSTLERRREALQLGVGNFSGLGFSPDGSRMAVTKGRKTGLRLWEMPGFEEIDLSGQWVEDRNYLSGAPVFTADGDKLLLRDWNAKTVEVYDTSSGRRLAEIPGGRGGRLALSPDGSMFAAGLEDNSIGLWDLKLQRRLATFTGHLYEPNDMIFSPDSTLLLSAAGSGTVRAWHVPTRREIGVVEPNSGVTRLMYSEAEQALVARRYGGYIEVWRLPEIGEIEALPNLFGLK